MSMSSTGATSAHPSEEYMSKPLWNYVTMFHKINDGSGNVSWQCNFCNKYTESSYTRVRAHLLRLRGHGIRSCSKVTAQEISEMQILEEEFRLRLRNNVIGRPLVPFSSLSIDGMPTFVENNESKKRKTSTDSSAFLPLRSEEYISEPLWNYVTEFSEINDGGGNVTWACNFCKKYTESSYTRVRAHLLRLRGQGIGACQKVTAQDIFEMQILEESRLRLGNNVTGRSLVPLPSDSMDGMPNFVENNVSKKRKTSTDSSAFVQLPSEEYISKPLWNYVTELQKINDGGGNVTWQCNFCNKYTESSYKRVRAHLLRLRGQGIRACSKVTAQDISEMQILEEDSQLRFGNKVTGTSLNDESKKRKTSADSSVFVPLPGVVSKEELDAEIARMFYSAGLPFQLAKNPYYLSSFKLATSGSIPGYVPPGLKMLMTTLLQKEKENINKLLQTNRWRWKSNGVSIISDGWSDLERGPFINFMAVTDGVAMFLKVVDCSGEPKDKIFISNVIKEVIHEVGHEYVVQVITDNVPNCNGAGELIEDEFPNISWTPCVVHTLNLSLKIICESKSVWISDIIGEVMQIKNFVINHPMRSEIFNEFSTLKLLIVAETRFAPLVVMLKRFRLIKKGLLSMVVGDRWPSYREVDVEKSTFVRGKLINENWWDSIEYILTFTTPIYDMLRACNMDKPCLHLVYDMWDTMIEKVKNAIYRHEMKKQDESSTFCNMVYQTLFDGWNKHNTPLHCFTHSLNPRYYTDEWLQEDPSRVPPHKDSKVSRGRIKYLKKCFPTSEDRTKVNIEYAKFSTMAGDFEDSDSITDRYLLDPKGWWILYGSFAPVLQTLAMKLLGQPSSSSCCERNWSFYSFMQSARKNISSQRVQDLLYVHNNLRLLSRRTPEYLSGETKMWDMSGDAFDLYENIGMLESANLSFDELELEGMVIAGDCM